MTTQIHPNIAQGMAEYQGGKPQGDIDLVKEVRAILVGLIPEEQVIAHYDNNRHVQEAADKISHVQLFLLNRFWYTQFCACPDNLQARLGLLPDADGISWLRIFKMTCVPFINKNNLPKQI